MDEQQDGQREDEQHDDDLLGDDSKNNSADELEHIADEQFTSLAPTTNKPAWARYAGYIVFGVVFFIYMVVVPIIGMIIDYFTPITSHAAIDMTFLEAMRLRTVSGVVMIIFLGIGASIGSFLNVVIYRLPRWLPLFWPPSACTGCKTKLTGKDNLPIIGWLKLGGKCRHCGIGVSFRYPLIEAIVAAVFGFFYFHELLTAGQNIPADINRSYTGVVWVLLYTKWNLVSYYFFHMFMLVVLLAWGMINYDRFRVPLLYAILGFLPFAILVCLFPYLNPTAARWATTLPSLPVGLTSCLLGCGAGLILGLVLDLVFWLPAVVIPAESKSGGSNLGEFMATISAESTTEEVDVDTADQNDGEPNVEPAEALVDSTNDLKARYGAPSDTPARIGNAAASLALVGAVLGIEAVCVVTVVAFVFHSLFLIVTSIFFAKRDWKPAIPVSLWVFILTGVYLTWWAQVHSGVLGLIARLSS
ncbi:MAG: prepilin peptidase [Planctomycetota bacterium]